MTLRVILDPPRSGPVNMAADEALLQRVGSGDSPPTLRFYQWDPPTISLGYFQKYADYQALDDPAGGLAVVRRLTGGGAILHDRELTYSLSLPLGHALLEGGPNKLYEIAHDTLIECLAEKGVKAWRGCRTDDSNAARGPFFCFARRHRYDVLIGNDKVAGSAQRRTRTAILQHGSIILQRRYEQQPAASAALDPRTLADGLAAALAASTDWSITPGAWSEPERAAASQMVGKYANAEWSRRR